MNGTFATTSLITNGLHCGPACRGIITAPFSLYCSIQLPPNFNQGSGGGGGPYPPSGAHNQVTNIQDFYTPTPEQYYQVPRDKEADYFRKYVNVTVSVQLGVINIDKTYKVPEKRKGAVIKLFNILNATQSRMVVSINSLKTIAKKAEISIRNLIVRKK